MTKKKKQISDVIIEDMELKDKELLKEEMVDYSTEGDEDDSTDWET